MPGLCLGCGSLMAARVVQDFGGSAVFVDDLGYSVAPEPAVHALSSLKLFTVPAYIEICCLHPLLVFPRAELCTRGDGGDGGSGAGALPAAGAGHAGMEPAEVWACGGCSHVCQGVEGALHSVRIVPALLPSLLPSTAWLSAHCRAGGCVGLLWVMLWGGMAAAALMDKHRVRYFLWY